MKGARFWLEALGVTTVLTPAMWLGAQDTVRAGADKPPLWGANVRLVQEFVIGQLDGPPEYALGDLQAAVAAPDGSFFVFDGNDRQIPPSSP